jgi:hypothetical protein
MPQFTTSWSTPCTTHSFILYKTQIIWIFSASQSTLIQANQINVESQNNVLHIKSPFQGTRRDLDIKTNLQGTKSFVNASPNTKVVDGRVLDDALLVNDEQSPESNTLATNGRHLD